jgi:hypothetical protein
VSLADLQKEKRKENLLLEFIYFGSLGLLWSHVKYGFLEENYSIKKRISQELEYE